MDLTPDVYSWWLTPWPTESKWSFSVRIRDETVTRENISFELDQLCIQQFAVPYDFPIRSQTPPGSRIASVAVWRISDARIPPPRVLRWSEGLVTLENTFGSNCLEAGPHETGTITLEIRYTRP